MSIVGLILDEVLRAERDPQGLNCRTSSFRYGSVKLPEWTGRGDRGYSWGSPALRPSTLVNCLMVSTEIVHRTMVLLVIVPQL